MTGGVPSSQQGGASSGQPTQKAKNQGAQVVEKFYKYIYRQLELLKNEPDLKEKLGLFEAEKNGYLARADAGELSTTIVSDITKKAVEVCPQASGRNFREELKTLHRKKTAKAQQQGKAAGQTAKPPPQKRAAPAAPQKGAEPVAKKAKVEGAGPKTAVKGGASGKRGATSAKKEATPSLHADSKAKTGAQDQQQPNQAPPAKATTPSSKAGISPGKPGTTQKPGARPPLPGNQKAAEAPKRQEQRKQASARKDVLDVVSSAADVVKAAGIDVDGEEELLGLDGLDEEENIDNTIQETELLTRSVLQSKLKSIASRYSLGSVNRDCIEFLSLAVRTRLSNFMDSYIKVKRHQKQGVGLGWTEEQIVPVGKPVRDELKKRRIAGPKGDDGHTSTRGTELRNCLFVVDHSEKDSTLVAQSVRWFARLYEVDQIAD
ncbi:hypothetical protein NDN08_006944 [Rhodosorus marinus]|uniref:Transcription initiation factor TFIID component TAF4 C-terminal domain-containing protein n=1 Tax=Rhodosorus marinus TaxID=101924 RepID=A0AAV8UJ54_9RHOD|nr:hypothetical protein NDN08_006944 [Rhodosorus marinus]